MFKLDYFDFSAAILYKVEMYAILFFFRYLKNAVPHTGESIR